MLVLLLLLFAMVMRVCAAVLNKKSGLLGVSGHNDLRTIIERKVGLALHRVCASLWCVLCWCGASHESGAVQDTANNAGSVVEM